MNIKDICCGVTPFEKEMIQKALDRIDELIECGERLHLKKGQIIFYEGHKPCGFYLLKKGRIALSRIMLDGKKEALPSEGKEIFGLFHLATNTPHCATGTAATEIETIFVSKPALLGLMKGDR